MVYPDNDLAIAYQKVFQLVQEASDQKSLAVLNTVGKPPYDTARQAGQFLRIVKQYERRNSKPAPEEWLEPSAEYENDTDSKHRFDGDDYSFDHFVGDKKLAIQPMSKPASGLSFRIPNFLIQGEADLMTPREISKPYFDRINAPEKEYFLISTAAHGFNERSYEYAVCYMCKDQTITLVPVKVFIEHP